MGRGPSVSSARGGCPARPPRSSVLPVAEVNDDEIQRFRALVRVPTVSYADEAAIAAGPFVKFVDLLAESFPLLHEHLTCTRILEHSLLFHWRGAATAIPSCSWPTTTWCRSTSGPWQLPPFGAESTTAPCRAAARSTTRARCSGCTSRRAPARRRLLPPRDVYLSFGGNEEMSGPGAPAAVDDLRSRGITPWLVLDEGGAIATPAFPVCSRRGGGRCLGEGPTTLGSVPRAEAGTPRLRPPSRPPRGSRTPCTPEKRQFSASLPSRRSRCSPGSRRTSPRRCGRCSPSPAGSPPRVFSWRPAASPPHSCIRPSPRPCSTAARAQRHRLERHGDAQPPHPRRRHRRVGDRARAPAYPRSQSSARGPRGGPRARSRPRQRPVRPLTSTIAELFADAVPTPYVMMAATDSRWFTAICLRSTGSRRSG